MASQQVRPSLLQQFLRGSIAASASLLCALPAASLAQAPASPPAAVAAAPALSLEDCLRIGRENQPAMKAAQASLAAAQTAQRSLDEIRLGKFLAKDLPIRKQQAAFGVSAAAANLAQVERDVDCSIVRTYYSVLYAREQKKVADQIILRLRAVVANGETLLGKEGAPADLTPLTVGRAKEVLVQVEGRGDQVNAGLQLATAGLREAIGVGPDFRFTVAEGKLPEPLPGVNKDQIIRLAISLRGEVQQAQSAAYITRLEVQAQAATRMVMGSSAARGGDMHVKPIPTGSFGDDYKPGAIGLDFPSLFVGPRETRMQRACELSGRSDAAAEKARNLVALDAEDAFLRWEEAFAKMGRYSKGAAAGDALGKRAISALESGVIQSYRDVLEILILVAQNQAHLNEARYNHAVALTELERVTGGGFAAGAAIPRPASQP